MSIYKSAAHIGIFLIFISGLTTHPAWGSDNCGYDPRNDKRISAKVFASWGSTLMFGGRITRTSVLPVGKGQCSLCHDFDPEYNFRRGPNLFGIEERSHTRIKEKRYWTHPITVGSLEPITRIRKGARTGEEYIRESVKCPSCYIVEGYEKKQILAAPFARQPIALRSVCLNWKSTRSSHFCNLFPHPGIIPKLQLNYP